jgi:hypothetical protein
MTNERKQYLEHQTKEFADVDGKRWCVRIEQGGGRRGVTPGDPPIARLIFRALGDLQEDEVVAPGEVDNWDLASYDDNQLRALLAEAQIRATYRRSE